MSLLIWRLDFNAARDRKEGRGGGCAKFQWKTSDTRLWWKYIRGYLSFVHVVLVREQIMVLCVDGSVWYDDWCSILFIRVKDVKEFEKYLVCFDSKCLENIRMIERRICFNVLIVCSR